MRLFRQDPMRRTYFSCAFYACLVIPYLATYTFGPATILKAVHLNDDRVRTCLNPNTRH
jgi:MFS transporter, putative metabolite transport protein